MAQPHIEHTANRLKVVRNIVESFRFIICYNNEVGNFNYTTEENEMAENIKNLLNIAKGDGALAAWIGMKKYGKKKFEEMAHAKHKKSNKPGGGERFKKLENELSHKKSAKKGK